MKKYNRIFTIVIDSFGAGAMPDAAEYGDAGTDTMGHISESVDEFHIPNLQKLGIADGILFFPERSKYRKGYDDRTLGDDGTSYHEAI